MKKKGEKKKSQTHYINASSTMCMNRNKEKVSFTRSTMPHMVCIFASAVLIPIVSISHHSFYYIFQTSHPLVSSFLYKYSSHSAAEPAIDFVCPSAVLYNLIFRNFL
jgi:hypothetical protein